MEEFKQYSAVIPLSEYEELKALRADKEKLKMELMGELIEKCGTHHHYHTENHSLKGLGIFGGFMAMGVVIITQMLVHVDWWWFIAPVIAICILIGIASES